jgi:beta-barrel assembly-enhancing protease
MKRILALAAILLIAGAGLYFAQRRQAHDAVSPNAVLDAAADLQRDVTRAPMHFTRISDEEEIRIGDELARHYTAAGPAPDARTEAYIQDVGARIAAHAKRRLPYHFHLIPNPEFINAFALPGGQVFIGSGIVNMMQSEDELAFVLGHEIEHIDHFHAVERVQIDAQLRHVSLDTVADLASIPMSLWQAGYSKDEEFEADREGLRLAAAAGYSPDGAVQMFDRWTRLENEYVIHAESPTEELSQVAIQGLTGYFRTHPLMTERLAQANAVIASDHLDTDRQLQPLRLPPALPKAGEQPR